LVLTFASGIWVLTHLTLEGAAGRNLGRGEATLAELCGFLTAAVLAISAVAVPLSIVLGVMLRDRLLGGADTAMIVLASATIPSLLVIQIAGYLLLASGRLRAYGWITAGSAAFQLLTVSVVALAGTLTPASGVAIVLAGLIVSGIAMTAVLGRVVGLRALRPHAERRLVKRVLRDAISLHPLAVSFQLMAQVDLLLVGLLASTSDAGLYSLSATLGDAAFLGSAVLAQGALHMQTVASEDEAVASTLAFSRQCLQIGIACAAAASALAYPAIVIVYGHAWAPSVLPFIILTLAGVAVSFESPIRTIVARVGRPLELSALALTTMAINVAATVVLVRAVGVTGAAMGTVIAYWVFAVGTVWLLKRASPGADLHELIRSRSDDVAPRLLLALRTRLAPRAPR
jgi:O-antigen/teichoic acid export membrane protein